MVKRRPTAESESIDRELSDLFSRFNVELGLFGRRPKLPVPDEAATQPPPTGFADIAHARTNLTDLMSRSMEILQNPNSSPAPPGAADDDDETGESASKDPDASLRVLGGQYEAWTDSLDKLMQTEQGQSATDPRAALALRLDHRLSFIWSLSAFRRQEVEFDRYNADFAAIVSFAEKLLRLDRSSSSSSFYLDPAVIRPLHWTATKCRNPVTRREALRLMSTFAPKENNVWDWRRSFEVGKMVMTLEEAALSHLPLEQRVPEDHHRIYETVFSDDSLARETQVKMWSKPNGPQGEMQSWEEVVPWDSCSGGFAADFPDAGGSFPAVDS